MSKDLKYCRAQIHYHYQDMDENTPRGLYSSKIWMQKRNTFLCQEQFHCKAKDQVRCLSLALPYNSTLSCNTMSRSFLQGCVCVSLSLRHGMHLCAAKMIIVVTVMSGVCFVGGVGATGLLPMWAQGATPTPLTALTPLLSSPLLMESLLGPTYPPSPSSPFVGYSTQVLC